MVYYFVRKHSYLLEKSELLERHPQGLGDSVINKIMGALAQDNFAANVRGLETIVENAVLFADFDRAIEESRYSAFDSIQYYTITADLEVQALTEVTGQTNDSGILPLRDARKKFEKLYIEALLKKTGGNISEAARIAGISERHLYAKIRKLRIP